MCIENTFIFSLDLEIKSAGSPFFPKGSISSSRYQAGLQEGGIWDDFPV